MVSHRDVHGIWLRLDVNAVGTKGGYTPASNVVSLDLYHNLLIKDEVVRGLSEDIHGDKTESLGDNLRFASIAIDLIKVVAGTSGILNVDSVSGNWLIVLEW